jgi:hypothetical protein
LPYWLAEAKVVGDGELWMKRAIFVAGLGIGAAMAVAAGAMAQPSALETYELLGTVGTHAVGASITIKDGTTFDIGHYFYDSQLKDIPLTGAVTGKAVTLTEPGGGVFHLTMQGNGGTGGDGSSFATSTDLTGTWTQGAQTLPVKLEMDSAYDGEPSAHLYADVTTESDAAFEARVRRFLTAVLGGDKPGAAAAVSYPLRVNGTHTTTIRTPAALIAKWSTVFTPALLAQLRTAVPHEMFVHEGQAMVAGGAAWFDAKGLSALNEP